MKLSCKVVEDLLPMYYDGVCSDDSAALIETHLKECPRCKNVLTDLQTEIEIPESKPDELKPLADIQAAWKKEKRRSIKKGVCVTLATMLALFSVWVCVWYFGYAVRYDKLTGKLERIEGESAAMTTASHSLRYKDYMILLKKPGFLGEGGFVRVGDKEGMVIFLDEKGNRVDQNQEMYFNLFFYPQFGGGYHTAVVIDDGKETWWIWLTKDLGYNYDLYQAANRAAEEIAYEEKLLAEHREEIQNLIDIVKEIWSIDLFE